MSWIERYHQKIWDKQIADDLESCRLDLRLAEVEMEDEAGLAYESRTKP
jgi:hypothetical protein